MKDWYQQKWEMLEGKDVNPGPHPGGAGRGFARGSQKNFAPQPGAVKILGKPKPKPVQVVDEILPEGDAELQDEDWEGILGSSQGKETEQV